jgi:hypothetical protein
MKEAIHHFNSFIDEFVPSSHKTRWKSLLAFNKPKFNKIQPHDIWPENNTEIKHCTILNVNLHDLMRNEPYIKYKNSNVMVIPCGHDNKKPEEMQLNEAIDGEYYLLEGLISIVKGHLALLINHDGEVCIFEK